MKSEGIKKIWQNKTARSVCLLLVALLLLFLVWKVFFLSTETKQKTATETRLQAILLEIEGVNKAEVLVTEEDGTPVSAVVVISGESSLLIDARAIDVTALALNLQKSKIRIYRGK